MSAALEIKNIIVIAMLVIAVFFDLKSKKLDNRLLIGLLIFALITQVILSGFSGLWISASSVLTAFMISLPLYLLHVFAGGDFKFLIALSVLLTWKIVVTLILMALFWGALLGVFQVFLRGESKVFLSNLMSLLKKKVPQKSSLHMIPFTVAFLFGFLSCLAMNQVGLEFL